MTGPGRDGRITHTVSFRRLRAVNRLTRPVHELCGAGFGIGLTEWRCLMTLPAEPGASGEDVARLMGLDRKAVSRTLRRLAHARRCSRAADPADRRRSARTLTDAGWRIVGAIVPEALARDAAMFGDPGRR